MAGGRWLPVLSLLMVVASAAFADHLKCATVVVSQSKVSVTATIPGTATIGESDRAFV
jgi:hypothetical protein